MTPGAKAVPDPVRRRPRFVADAMLGSLARKLRALGFDTEYYRSGDDAGIITVAAGTGRVVLTSDRALAARARPGRFDAFLVSGKTDAARLSSIGRQCRALGLEAAPAESRCSVCNGRLENVPRAKASALVSPKVLSRHRLFFRCASCGQAYWRGGHWKKLRSLGGRLGQT